MNVFIDLLIILVWLLLVLLKAIPLKSFYISDFEQQRRHRDLKTDSSLRVAGKLAELKILLELKFTILTILLGLLLVWHRAGWAAFIIATILLCLVFLVSNLAFIRRYSEKLFWLASDQILQVTNFLDPLLRMVLPPNRPTAVFASKDELLDVIAKGHSGLSAHESNLVSQVLNFSDQKVKDMMVKRAKIVSVKDSDLLGPKLVDQLHASGFNVFPVYKGSIDSPVGTLYLTDIADVKVLATNPKVHDLMRHGVYTLSPEDSLEVALKSSLDSGAAQFLVVDDKQKVRGLIGLQDILDKLIDTSEPQQWSD
jgi:CBS domain containing-hemolysin-like protein